jgi:hypothetical protein
MGGKGRDRTVFQRDDGQWVQKRNDASRAGSANPKQGDAVKDAREMLKNSGGGELTIIGRDGRIRSKDTIAPGNDPNPPRDKEH